mmetsp:Transcript_10088/g.15188  ORF Transcript_10088/g.15188 Transcript_10088/m.15188 type:complete len:191 (+) Transcript_10088:404-976(+)
MRATDNQGGTIRLPIYMQDKIRTVKKSDKSLHDELGRAASKEELAERLGYSEDKIQWLKLCQKMQPYSLSSRRTRDSRFGSESPQLTVGDSVDDPTQTPEKFIENKQMQNDIKGLLCRLNQKEQIVLRMRFGLDNGGKKETLKNVAEHVGISSDGVRMIEIRALEKLRHFGESGNSSVGSAKSNFIALEE